jgi:hypothetical protein
MAETEAIFKLRVDTGNSVNDVENLTSAVKETQTATEGKGVQDFEKKLNQLDKTLKDGNLTMRQRSQLVRQYQQIALQAGETSPIGDRAVRSAAALTDQIGDLNQRVKLLSSDTVKLDTALQGISVGASAFQGVQSAIALTGVENEELIKSMQKLQAVQGVVNSVQAITNALNKDAILGIQLRVALEKAKNFVLTGSIAGTTALATAEGGLAVATNTSTLAMKAFRIALISTGIGAIVVGVALLATNFDKVTKAVSGAYERVMRFADGVKGLRLLLLPLEIAVVMVRISLEKLGLIESDQDRKRQANHKKHIERIDAQIKKQEEQRKKREIVFNNEQSAYDREIALLESVGKSTFEVRKQKIQASIDYQKEKFKELQLELKAIEFLSKSSKFYEQFYGNERMEILRSSLNDAENLIKDSENQMQVLVNQNEKENKEKAKKRSDDELKRLKQLSDAEKKLNEQRIKSEDEQFNLSLELMQDGFDKEFQQLVIQSDKRMEQAHGDAELEKQVVEQFEIDKAGLIKKYADIELAKIAEKEKKRLETIDFYNRLILDGFDLEAYEFQQNQAQQLATLQQALQDKVLTQEQYNEALKALAKDLSEFEVDLEKRKQEKIKAERDKAFQEQVQQFEKVIEVAEKFAQVTSALNGLMNASDQERLKQVKGNAVEEEKIKRRMFEREKKQRIAESLIATASAITKSVAASPTTFGLPFSAFAAATGALQIAAISKQTFDGGGDGSFNAPPPSTQAPVTTANETNPQQGGTDLPKMTKVVVLESDISNIQNKVKVTESLSGF